MDKHERIAEIKSELSFLDNHREIIRLDGKALELLKTKLSVLEEQLKKENKDVEKLEKTTIISLFHTLTGGKEEALEKEKYEAMQASIQYHQVLNEYQVKENYLNQLQERFNMENLLESELKTLQLDILSSENPTLKNELENKISEYENKKLELKEVEEALSAGEDVHESFERVLGYLSSAENWGIYDMVGGGMISSMIKHGKIDDAQNALQLAKLKLEVFEKEMKDIKGWNIHLEEFSVGLVMFDQFFDNIFTDFMVQNKISKSIENMSNVQTQIENTLDKLFRKKEEVNHQCVLFNQEVKNLLKRI